MGLTRLLAAGLLGATLLIGTSDISEAKVTAKQIEKAASVAEIIALGATKLTSGQFKSMVVDKKMSGQGWSWIIDSNGTTSSASTDGSWKEDNVPWNMKGDAYCTKIEGKTACRDVYVVGGYMRMSNKADPAMLSSWTVKLPK